MLRSPQDTALVLATIFKRSGEKRARISEKTIKLIGYRTKLRGSFADRVAEELLELGLMMIELDNGGYGLIPAKSLEAARPITARRFLTDTELALIRHGESIDSEQLFEELTEDESGVDNDSPE